MSRKYEDFSRRLNQLIGKKNISPSELCVKADISKQSLSQYICGSRLPQAQALINLSDALGVSIDFLLTGKEKGNIIDSDGLTKEQIDYLTESAETFKKYNDIMSRRNNPLTSDMLYYFINHKNSVSSNNKVAILIPTDQQEEKLYSYIHKKIMNPDKNLTESKTEDDSQSN